MSTARRREARLDVCWHVFALREERVSRIWKASDQGRCTELVGEEGFSTSTGYVHLTIRLD